MKTAEQIVDGIRKAGFFLDEPPELLYDLIRRVRSEVANTVEAYFIGDDSVDIDVLLRIINQ